MPLLEMKTVRITEKGQIAIPKDVRRNKPGFKEGAKVALLAFEDHIEVRPLKQFSETLFTLSRVNMFSPKIGSVKRMRRRGRNSR